MCSACRVYKRVSDPLELKLQAAGRPLVYMLQTTCESSARAPNALKCWATGIKGVRHHAQLDFSFFKVGFYFYFMNITDLHAHMSV